LVIEAVNERFRDIRARRSELAEDPGYLRRVLHEGNERAREIAEHTLQDVRARMHTSYSDIPAATSRAHPDGQNLVHNAPR
jgi:tryptophanyl-tRNA synthetase